MFNIFIHHETVNVAMICLESELTPRHNTTRLVHIMYTLANYICEYWEISWGVSRWGFYLTIYVGNPPGISRLAGGQPPPIPRQFKYCRHATRFTISRATSSQMS